MEPKLWTQSEPEPKINNFGFATLKFSNGMVMFWEKIDISFFWSLILKLK